MTGNRRMKVFFLICLSAALLLSAGCSKAKIDSPVSKEAVKKVPVLDGEFWMIGDSPDLGELDSSKKECVDHYVFQSGDGMWNLWGCIRGTTVGRVLYHWDTKNITDNHWNQTGEIMRVDSSYGESKNDWDGEEWMQSPFVVKEGDTYYMFFGGHSTGYDAQGNFVVPGDKKGDCQINLMTSKDGRTWERYKNKDGMSRVFSGPGETRDPCLLKIGDLWYLYYAGYEYVDGEIMPGVYARTSKNLTEWSDYKLVHRDRSTKYGGNYWDTECPHVVMRDGYYYLFRTENYAKARTHVFRSQNPMDFGIGDASDKYIGMIAVAAPEIIVDQNGQEYISSNHDLKGGTQICKLKWVEEKDK